MRIMAAIIASTAFAAAGYANAQGGPGATSQTQDHGQQLHSGPKGSLSPFISPQSEVPRASTGQIGTGQVGTGQRTMGPSTGDRIGGTVHGGPQRSFSAYGDPNLGGPDGWRYRWHDGRWWYWLPENRWMYWENDRWIDHNQSGSMPEGSGQTTFENGAQMSYGAGYQSYQPYSSNYGNYTPTPYYGQGYPAGGWRSNDGPGWGWGRGWNGYGYSWRGRW